MKILHVLDHSAPIQSGYAFRTLAILREQHKFGCDTAHITSPRQGVGENGVSDAAGLYFSRSVRPPKWQMCLPIINEVFVAMNFITALDKVVTTFKPDVVHVHSPVLNLFPTTWVCKRHHIPVVYEMRSLWEDSAVEKGKGKIGSLKYRISYALETLGIKHFCSRLIVISEGLKKEVVSRGLSSEKITVVPNGVDLEKFKEKIIVDEELQSSLRLKSKIVIGYAGSLHPYEGLELLIEAFATVQKKYQHARLIILGDGDDRTKLEDLARGMGIQEYVYLLGQVPHEDIPRYFSLMSVLAYPRKKSRLTELVTPLKPLEAMAQGIVVVASDIGGHRELIAPANAGLLFEAGSSQSLSNALCELVESSELRQTLSKNARQYVQDERTWQTTVSHTRQVYDSVLSIDQNSHIVDNS